MSKFRSRSGLVKKPETGSSLPSLKQERHAVVRVKKPTFSKEQVAKSDADSIQNADIRFCSFPMEIISEPIENSKDFDSNRPNEFQPLFLAKLHECEKLIDMSPEKSGDRSAKILLLSQLSKSFQHPNLVRKLTVEAIEEVIKMVQTNISRDFPPVTSFPPTFLFDRVESFCDDCWFVLEHVYDVLDAVLRSTHVPHGHLNTSLSHTFIVKLFACFASPDVRERNAVKANLYTIAGRTPDKVMFLFTLIKNAMIDAMSDQPIKWGLPQILELFHDMSSTIPQFTSLSFEFLLKQILIPLHLMTNFAEYYMQLLSSIEVILVRNSNFVDYLIFFLLNHFPIASQKKQMVFLQELDDIVTRFWQVVLPNCAFVLIARLAYLVTSPCIDISQRAFMILFSDPVVMLIKQYYCKTAPVLVARATAAARSHWHEAPKNLALCLLQELQRMDPSAFNLITSPTGSIRLSYDEQAAQRKANWEMIKSASEPRSIKASTGPLTLHNEPIPLPAIPVGGAKTVKTGRSSRIVCRGRKRL